MKFDAICRIESIDAIRRIESIDAIRCICDAIRRFRDAIRRFSDAAIFDSIRRFADSGSARKRIDSNQLDSPYWDWAFVISELTTVNVKNKS